MLHKYAAHLNNSAAMALLTYITRDQGLSFFYRRHPSFPANRILQENSQVMAPAPA